METLPVVVIVPPVIVVDVAPDVTVTVPLDVPVAAPVHVLVPPSCVMSWPVAFVQTASFAVSPPITT